MIKDIWHYFKAWLKGEPAELQLEGEISFAWWEVFLILVIIGLIVYWIW